MVTNWFKILFFWSRFIELCRQIGYSINTSPLDQTWEIDILFSFVQGPFVLTLVCESNDLVFCAQDCDTAKQSPRLDVRQNNITQASCTVYKLSRPLQVVIPDLEPFLFDY